MNQQDGAPWPYGAVEIRLEPPTESERLLREEVAQQRAEREERERQESFREELKNRVSVAAIILTTALSFIGNVKGDRADAAGSAKSAANEARRQGAELWAYYQTKLAERTSLELARDRVKLDLARRGFSREDQEAKLDAFKLTGYEERIRDFDGETQRVFYRVQDLERQEDVQQRADLYALGATYFEMLTGRARYLDRQVDLAAIGVSAREQAKPSGGLWDFSGTLENIQTAFLATIRQLLRAAEALVVALSALVPVFVLVGIAWLVVRRVRLARGA